MEDSTDNTSMICTISTLSISKQKNKYRREAEMSVLCSGSIDQIWQIIRLQANREE